MKTKTMRICADCNRTFASRPDTGTTAVDERCPRCLRLIEEKDAELQAFCGVRGEGRLSIKTILEMCASVSSSRQNMRDMRAARDTYVKHTLDVVKGSEEEFQ